jgi:hypothetical protein
MKSNYRLHYKSSYNSLFIGVTIDSTIDYHTPGTCQRQIIHIMEPHFYYKM